MAGSKGKGGFQASRFTFNTGKLMDALMRYYTRALEPVKQQLIENMKTEMGASTKIGIPGKPSWIKEFDFERQADDVTREYIEMYAGIPGSPEKSGEDFEFIRAMIFEAGSGDKAGGKPVHAGHYGRPVWGDNLQIKHASRSLSKYNLPDNFNREGNHYFENAMKKTKEHFDDALRNAMMNLPDDVFYSCLEAHIPS